MPAIDNRIPLGKFLHSEKAIISARRYFMRVNACLFCNKEFFEPINNLLFFDLNEIIYN